MNWSCRTPFSGGDPSAKAIGKLQRSVGCPPAVGGGDPRRFPALRSGHPKIRVARCAAGRKRAGSRHRNRRRECPIRSSTCPTSVTPASRLAQRRERRSSHRKTRTQMQRGRRNEGRRRFGRAAGKESLGFSCPPRWRIKERLRLADQCATDCVGNSGMRASADGEVGGSRFSILPGPFAGPARIQPPCSIDSAILRT